MADVAISGLPAGTATGTDEVPVNQGGVTKKVTAQSIADLAPIPSTFLAADGSAASPSYGFVSEPGQDLGMYRTGNSIGWTAQGVHAMQLDPGGDLTIVGNIAAANFPQAITGTANAAARYDGGGNLASWDELQQNVVSKGISHYVVEQLNNGGGNQVHTWNVNFDPQVNSPNENWLAHNTYVQLDVNSSGFSMGTNGTAATIYNGGFNHQGTGNVGGLNYINMNSTFGNGTDPITIKGLNGIFIGSNFAANTTLDGGLYGLSISHNVNASAAGTSNFSITDLNLGSNISIPVEGYLAVNLGGNISEITNNHNYTGVNINPTITTLTGNAGFNGVAINSTVSAFGATGGWNGLNVSPTTTGAHYANGIVVNMNNAGMYAGTPSALVIQDLTLTFNSNGDNNNITIEYVNDGTAGAETATFSNPAITVHIQSGVSTALQIKAALEANLTINSNITVTVSGVGGNAQVTQAATNFVGGTWPGTKRAADLTGDVNINGGLAFTGGLSVGALNAFFSEPLTNGGGNPDSGHFLITQPTVAANVTVANADYLGVNTASLIQIGANATVTTAFLGVCALGLPAVATIGAGATVDRVAGAAFALSLGGGTGTINQVALCRALAIGDGATTVTRLYGYEMAMPFGAVGTDAWGLYLADDINNWMKGSLRIGGTTITDDKADTGFKLHVLGDTKLEGVLQHLTGNLGLFGATPVAQPTTAITGATVVNGAGASVKHDDTFDGYTLDQIVAALRVLGVLA